MNYLELIEQMTVELASCEARIGHLRRAIGGLQELAGLPVNTRSVSRQREHQRARQAAGLCVYCKNLLAPGSRAMCSEHLAKNRNKYVPTGGRRGRPPLARIDEVSV